MEYLKMFLYTVFDSFIADFRTIIVVLVLFYSSRTPQDRVFSVFEIICIAVSLIDFFITGSVISAIILALLLAPRIPQVYVGILCVLLSVAEFFTTGGIASIIVSAFLWGNILYKNRKNLIVSIPLDDIRIINATTESRILPLVCFTIFWIIRSIAFAAPDSIRDDIRFVRNFSLITQAIGRFVAESIVHPEAFSASVHKQSVEEGEFLRIEDPEGVRILRNSFAAYYRAEQMAEMRNNTKETIELRVSKTRIRPGERVKLEAIPSSETPALGSSILLVSNPLGYTTPLSRQWLRNRYRGSVKFKTTDTGVYYFGISTTRYDKKTRKMMSYDANRVSVAIAPDSSQLSRIFIQQRAGILVAEGLTTDLNLYGVGLKGEVYDISAPEAGTHWTVEDESKAIITREKSYDGSIYTMVKGLSLGETRIRARYGSLEAQSDVRVYREEPVPNFSISDIYRAPTVVSLTNNMTIHAGDVVQFIASTDVFVGPNPITEWKFSDVNSEIQYVATNYGYTFQWTPPEGTYTWTMRYIYSMSNNEDANTNPWIHHNKVTATQWSKPATIIILPSKQAKPNNKNLPLKAQSNIIVIHEEKNIPTKFVHSAPIPPPAAERPRPISPHDNYIARLEERLQLEVTSFDVSKRYEFKWSSWHVYMVNPETDNRGIEVAYLRRGNSEKAEWIPKRTGTYEWVVTYYYDVPYSYDGINCYDIGPKSTGEITSFPQRIVVVK